MMNEDPYPVSKAPMPEHPDGVKYRYNCCMVPDVWDYSDDSRRCQSCGYRWETEQ